MSEWETVTKHEQILSDMVKNLREARRQDLDKFEELQKELETLRAQLKDAENAIDYYAVEACNEDWCERYLPETDREIMDYLSGNRAREYQAKYKGEDK